jgi:hypothetical protein
MISELFKVTAEVIYDTDMQHGDGRDYWPFHPVFLDSLVAPIVFKEILRLIESLKNKGYTLTDIGKLIYSPTKVANYQYLWPIKTLKFLPYKQKYELAKYFIMLLTILRNGEPFCEKGRNLIWSREILNQNIKQYENDFITTEQNLEMAQLLSKLEGLLVSYAETLYYYMIDLSRMMHGPYLLENKSTIFVKEYLHLKAGELWDVVSDFPFDHFKEIGIYQDIEITVFFMGHTHSNPPFPKAIKKFAIIVDGKVIKNVAELRNLYEKVKEVTERAAQHLTEKAEDEDYLLKKGVDMFFYPLKPLYHEVGENWKDILPEAYKFAYKVKDKIKVPGPWGDWSKEKAVAHLLKLMDFRRKQK